MNKNRLEAFSDGVIAIIITIMVLELKVPHGHELSELNGLIPVFISYVLSFIYVGIYWNNHHHMLHTCRKVTGPILWANLHLLFWLSLIPFVTGWLGEHHASALPTALYGSILLMAALAYTVLSFGAMAMHRRLLWFSVPSQALQVFPLFLMAHVVELLLRMVGGGVFPGFWGLIAPVLEALLWPLASWVLLAPQRRPPDRDQNRPL